MAAHPPIMLVALIAGLALGGSGALLARDGEIVLHDGRPQVGTPADAQNPAAPLPKITHRTVTIDAVVTDAKGAPVLNLTAGDFDIVENGVAQKLEAAELRVAGPTPDRNSGSVAPVESDDDELRAAREPGTRVVALLLDEFHVSPGASTERVRVALRQFVDEELRPRDLLIVLKPLDSVTHIRFTRDRTEALHAIDTFAGRKGDYSAPSEFEQKYFGSSPAAVQAGRVQIVMAALRALTMKLGDLQAGRAAIVVVSEGPGESDLAGSPRAVRTGGEQRRISEIEGLVRAASRFHVAVYAFDPAERGNDANATGNGDAAAGMLRTLAVQTGGETVPGGRTLSSGLARVARDLDAYYLLTYTSTHQPDGRFYNLQVRVKRKGAQVRTRSGYWAPLGGERPGARAADATPPRPPRVIRRSSLIETWLGLTVADDGRLRVVFTWEPASTPAGDRGPQPAAVAIEATTERGVLLFEGEIAAPRRPSGGAGLADRAVFDAGPGRIQLNLRILAVDGTPIERAGSDVEVPDTARADPLILPPQVFRTASAREFGEISADPAAAPNPSREFRRTNRLLLRVPTYSASGAAVQVSARVLNRWGQVLRDVPPMEPATPADPPQFDLPLSWLAPGEYTIELTATTSANTAKEVIRFKVRR